MSHGGQWSSARASLVALFYKVSPRVRRGEEEERRRKEKSGERERGMLMWMKGWGKRSMAPSSVPLLPLQQPPPHPAPPNVQQTVRCMVVHRQSVNGVEGGRVAEKRWMMKPRRNGKGEGKTDGGNGNKNGKTDSEEVVVNGKVSQRDSPQNHKNNIKFLSASLQKSQ